MADDRIVSLDVGSQQVTAASFSKTSGGGLRLDKLHRSDLVGDPNEDAGRNAQTKMALKEAAKSLALGKAETKYTISSNPVLMKFASLPAIDGEKLEEIVGFEAQQQVPYPIDEVVWDYQLVGDPGGFEVEVILAAVKADELDDIDDLVTGAGIKTCGADISPIALYNALRFNYSDIDGTVMLIDIGARTTDLVFMEGNEVFIRTIKLGGAEISRSIAKEFGIDFPVADAKKVNDGFVALGGPYADHEDPEIAGMSKIIRNSLTRMHSEIMRTINFYRSQQGGSAPQIALLSGASTSLPFIREFFAEKLNIPIDHFNALRNITVSSKLEQDGIASQAHTLGTLVGSALQQAGPTPAAIDLVPASVKAERAMDKKKPALIMAVAVLVALLGALGFFFQRGSALSDQKAASISDKADDLTFNHKKIEDLKKKIEDIDEKQKPFFDAALQRVYWVRAFDYLSGMMEMDTMWITGLTPMSEGIPVIEADSLSSGGGADGSQIIDALLVQGLWRKDRDSGKEAQMVFDFFERLKEDAKARTEAGLDPFFDLTESDLKDSEVKVDGGVDGDRYAYTWQFTLPLPESNRVPFTK